MTKHDMLIALLRSMRGGLGPLDGVVNTDDMDRALCLAEELRDEATK